jgi:hypothetical protein
MPEISSTAPLVSFSRPRSFLFSRSRSRIPCGRSSRPSSARAQVAPHDGRSGCAGAATCGIVSPHVLAAAAAALRRGQVRVSVLLRVVVKAIWTHRLRRTLGFAPAQAQHQMQRRLLLEVVVREPAKMSRCWSGGKPSLATQCVQASTFTGRCCGISFESKL